LEASILSRDKEATAALIARFAPLAGKIHPVSGLSMGRLLGDGERLLENPDRSFAYYNQALEVCTKIRFRPEIALIRLGLAELLLDHYPDERAAAIEHLDFAIAEFREMKMQPSLERALKHKELLKA